MIMRLISEPCSQMSEIRIVYNGYDEGDYIVIPRGCYDELISRLSSAGVRYEVVDKRHRSFSGSYCIRKNSLGSVYDSPEEGQCVGPGS